MIEAGLRNMTVSVKGARLLRSAHQSCTSRSAFKGPAIYRVSGMFRGQAGNRPGGGPFAAFRIRFCRNMPG
jgi:hypothetical protein